MEQEGHWGDGHMYPEPDEQPEYPWAGPSRATRQTSLKDYHDDHPMLGDRSLDESSQTDEDEDDFLNDSANDEDIDRYLKHHRPVDGDRSSDEDFVDTDLSEDDAEELDLSDASISDTDFAERPVAGFEKTLLRKFEKQLDGLPEDNTGKGGRKGRPKGALGPRKAAAPSPEIKAMLAQANAAFVAERFNEAERIAKDIILKNNEIYDAYTILAEVQQVEGDPAGSTLTFILGAHLKPKDSEVWRNCAYRALQHREQVNDKACLQQAVYCLSRAIATDPEDMKTKFERASLFCELGYHRKAANEYLRLLSTLPNDPMILKTLAEVCIEINDVQRAVEAFDKAFDGLREQDVSFGDKFGWADINAYVELFDHSKDYGNAIKQLKRLSRWLLGRQEEAYWDSITEDDREWDLEDSPRRIEVADYIPSRFDLATYGSGMPLEIRMKLGEYRLKFGHEHFDEALEHFNWLDPDDDTEGAKLHEFPDLFKDAGNALFNAGYPQNALTFYEAIQFVDGSADASTYIAMAKCYEKENLLSEAEECLKTALEIDTENIEALVRLAKIYQDKGIADKASEHVTLAMKLGRHNKANKKALQDILKGTNKSGSGLLKFFEGAKRGSYYKRKTLTASQLAEEDISRTEKMKLLQLNLNSLKDRMRTGDDEATLAWMQVATMMRREFLNNRFLNHPSDRGYVFLGFSREAKRLSMKGRRALDVPGPDEILKNVRNGEIHLTEPVPTAYRGISFDAWLDIFLDFAICLVKKGDTEAAYTALNQIMFCNIFYHSSEHMHRINTCWIACAIYAQDEATACKVARSFTRDFTFNSDGFRLYSLVSRLCQTSTSWFNSQSAQKFMMRQIHVMDKGYYSKSKTKRNGAAMEKPKINVVLLTLYGHMMLIGGSYAPAIHWFYRAAAQDPQNPMLNLSIALAYIHHSLKRQSDNRHYFIMQGLHFLFKYYDIRKTAPKPEQRQEAEYNVGRTFHLIGLNHLAVPYYERTLQVASEALKNDDIASAPDLRFTRDAAYNLRTMYAMTGNMGLAGEVTQKWLSI